MNTFKLTQFKAKTNIEKNQGRTPRHYKAMRVGLILAAMMFGGVFYGLATIHTPETEAIEPSSFNAGYLIDDSVFYNPNTMTVAEIQKLLDDKSPACDMWGTGLISGRKYPDGTWVPAGTTRAQYAKVMREKYGNTKYHDPPYVCINKYYENPETHQSLYETQGVATAGMKSAAQIIYDVAQEYSINPQVLLVMIKKESLVWGDNWPLKYEYNTVMGYGCPDNAPCNEAYYGFYNQVQKAAWQFKYYREHPTSYHYKPNQNNNVYYHPNMACGTKQVYLENIATTSLYIYTPYTPNDAALRAYPGTGDGCSSYGNRNFYMFFREWFGNTYGSSMYIDERHDVLGGDNGVLGKKTTDVPNCAIGHADACVQAYENGVIIYSPKTGAWENYGVIRDKFVSSGSVDGELGFPTSPVNCNIGHEGACVQAYENGAIIYSPETGAIINSGKIRETFVENGSVDGDLGFPVEDSQNIDGETYQKYQNGVISNFGGKEYFALSGDIYNIYLENKDTLKAPTNRLNCNIGHEGACVQAFENGVIIQNPKTGIWEQYGAIREKFIAEKSVDGVLGFPTSGIIFDGGLEYQEFENGIIYSYADEVISSYGEIYKKYLTTKDLLGNPTANINANIGHAGASVQAFENGVIIHNPRTGTWEQYGEIRSKFVSLGSVDGALGFPTGPMNCSIGFDGACVQAYENGVIIHNQKTGTWGQTGAIRQKFIEVGSVNGDFGFPTGDISTSKYLNYVIYQHFEGGTIYYDKNSGRAWGSLGIF